MGQRVLEGVVGKLGVERLALHRIADRAGQPVGIEAALGELVLRALRFLDPDIERIAATVSSRTYGYARGGFIIRRGGSKNPIPIGSMGDGMWRMLTMAIVISHCRDGVLLVDEIDTGLHYTVMAEMWKLIFGVSKDLNVQIFATTHSFDCMHSLAAVCQSSTREEGAVTIQRIASNSKRRSNN